MLRNTLPRLAIWVVMSAAACQPAPAPETAPGPEARTPDEAPPAAQGPPAAEPADPEPEADPFAGCSGTDHGSGLILLSCGDYVVIFLPSAKTTPDDQIVGSSALPASSALTFVPGDVTTRRVGGTLRTAAEVSLRSGPEVALAGWHVAVPLPGQRDMKALAGCYHPPDLSGGLSRCDAILDELARDGVPDGIPLEEAPTPTAPTLAGQPLPVPEGCAVSGPDAISCGQSRLNLSELPAGQAPTVAAVFEAMKPSLARLGLQTSAPTECRVAGVDADCLDVVLELDGGVMDVLLARARLGGAEVALQCDRPRVSGETRAPIVPPCDAVVAYSSGPGAADAADPADEAIETIDVIAKGLYTTIALAGLHDGGCRVPPSVGWTPAGSPCDSADELYGVAPEAWSAPTWKAIGYEAKAPHRFRYEIEAKMQDDGTAEVVVRASADLDCDGTWSLFQLTQGLGVEGGACVPVGKPGFYVERADE